MEKRKMYYGLDLLKFALAILVAARHMIQVFYGRRQPVAPSYRQLAVKSGRAGIFYYRRLSPVS